EVYDAIGRFRASSGGRPIDPSGEITGTERSDGPVAGPIELSQRLAVTDEVRACMVRQWFRFAFGRQEAVADEPLLASALAAFRASDYRIPDLLLTIATDGGFRSIPAPAGSGGER